MIALDLKALVQKMSPPCRRGLEGAAGLCLSRTNPDVEIEHWLAKLIEEDGTDLLAIFRHYGVDHARLATQLTGMLDRLKTGNDRPPALSPDLIALSREAWLLASVRYGENVTRSGHLVATMLNDSQLSRQILASLPELEKIEGPTLLKDLSAITAETAEAGSIPAPPSGGTGSPVGTPGSGSKTPSLDQFTVDVTSQAEQGKIDPVLGRDEEIRQVIDILSRRRQNNPIMTGEPGVGKTAVVEGFALRIAQGDVPEFLKNVRIRSLDLSLLEAGAGMKGEFENRLKNVINEVKGSPVPIILFIDEAHTMIGAGGQAGQGDAANILKPALARGELRTIAATTWAEYKKYFERDAALARRFQVVKVEEPAEDVAIAMVRGLVDTLEGHHGVRILDEAVIDAVRLSKRYISGRQLPDKAVSLLDTACARVAIGLSATPAEIEDRDRKITQLKRAQSILEREQESGADHADALESIAEQLKSTGEELESLRDRYARETELVGQIRALREQLEQGSVEDGAAESGDAPATDHDALRTELASCMEELTGLQGEDPLVHVCVDGPAIADVVSNWTGIPVGRMVGNQIRNVLELTERMKERVVGQTHSLRQISQSIQTSRAKLTDPKRPIGVFMLAGPSGVGKTETAVTLANLLYGGEQNMTVINMSEFKEEHKVSLLMGSPPGYVGYGEGGVLTEAVRRRPYSVVLLDELEKAHEGVQEIFYQVFDKGILRDGEGRDIDFKNTVIIMTSNAGTELIMSLCADPDTRPEPEAFASALHEELLKTFKPAFLGRCQIIPYYPLDDSVLRKIVELKLGQIVDRVQLNYQAKLKYTPDVITQVLARCQEVESGARNVDHILNHTLLPDLSSHFLARMADGETISEALVSVSGDGSFQFEIS